MLNVLKVTNRNVLILMPTPNTVIMKLRKIALFCCALAIAGCDDESAETISPDKTALLTLKVETSYETSKTDDWLVILNTDGSVLEWIPFETSQTYQIATEKTLTGASIGVAVLRHLGDGANKYYNNSVYLNITPGKIFTLQNPPVTPANPETGYYSVNVSGIPNVDQFGLGNGKSDVCLGSGGFGSATINCSATGKSLLQISSNSEPPRYKFLDELKDGDKLDLTWNDLTPFNKTITYELPSPTNLSLVVYGREEGQGYGTPGYNLSYHVSGDQHSSISAGYLESLSKFETRLNASYSKYTLRYTHLGDNPDPNLVWPKLESFGYNRKEITDFSATSVEAIKYRNTSYYYQDYSGPTVSVYWNVYSSELTHVIGAFPLEITNEHPALLFDKLKSSQTEFITSGRCYCNFIDHVFGIDTDPTEETVSILVY
jgi:hypothetical protein